MTEFHLLLVGYGNVARRFESLLHERRDALARDHGLRARIVGVATRRHGQMYDAGGLGSTDSYVASGFSRTGPRYVASGFSRIGPRYVASGFSRTLVSSRTGASTMHFIREATRKSAAAAKQRRLVVIETTTLDIAHGEPAIGHIRAALAGGAHVVTTNKGPVAFAYRELSRAAGRANRRFLFEGAVMDGVPIFNLVRDTLPAVRVLGFRGVLNSTTNFILTAMEQGQPFDRALAEMQARGIAEADASLDVDGWDAAAKTAALANVLMDATLTPPMVGRMGITPDTGRLACEARAAGRRLKLVARAERVGRRITASVAPEALPGDDLLAGLDGQQNALILKTDLLEEIAIVQRSGSLTETAYALLSDLIGIARDVTGLPARGRSPSPARRRRTP